MITEIRTRHVKGKERKERYYFVTCCVCDEGRWLRKHDADRAQGKPCKRCSARVKGAKGWQATAKKYGKKCAVRHVQTHRLEHPSALEIAVSLLLDDLHVTYEREYWLESGDQVYLLDFVLFGSLVIEVQGKYLHETYHQERDARKAQAIRNAGMPFLELKEMDIRSGCAIDRLRGFIEREGYGKLPSLQAEI